MLQNEQLWSVSKKKDQKFLFDIVSSQDQVQFTKNMYFTKQNNLLITCTGNQLILWQFINKTLIQKKLLASKIEEIASNLDVSTLVALHSEQQEIQIWKQNIVGEFHLLKQKIKIAECKKILVSNADDQILLISETNFQTLQVDKNKEDFQQYLQHSTKQIRDAMWNNCTQNQLLLIVNEDCFCIWQRRSNDRWYKFQRIIFPSKYKSFFFYKDSIYCFQEQHFKLISIFKQNINNQLFEHKQVEQMIDESNFEKLDFKYFSLTTKILLVLHKGSLYVTQLLDTEPYIQLQQIINLKCYDASCVLSADSKYLITWNLISQAFKIRELKVL